MSKYDHRDMCKLRTGQVLNIITRRGITRFNIVSFSMKQANRTLYNTVETLVMANNLYIAF